MGEMLNSKKISEYDDDKEDAIDLREIFYTYLSYWKWIVFSVCIFLLLGVFAYMSWPRKYEASTSVILKEEGSKASSNSALGNLESLGLLSTTNNVDNEVAVFSSPNLVRQAVDTLSLYATYWQKGWFRNKEVYKDCPYVIELEGVKPGNLKGNIELSIGASKEGFADVSGIYALNKKKIELTGGELKLPCAIDLPNKEGRVLIYMRTKTANQLLESDENPLDFDYKVYISNTQTAVENLLAAINVESTSKTSSVLNISLRATNSQKAVDFLSQLVAIYNKNNVADNGEIALNTTRFVNERLLSISGELKNIENKVVSYKRQEGITDVSAETKVFLEQNAEVEKKRIDAETQLNLVQLVEDYVNKSENQSKLIPNLGITDQGLASIITEYNNQLLNYERIERSTNEDNPARIRALAALKNTRQSIQSAILNVKRAMNINKKDLATQAGELASRKRSIPEQEYGLTEILRQQQVIQSIYIFLMQTREQSNITLAATSDKAKVISDPIPGSLPVSPKRNIIFLAFFILGLIVPIVVIYLRNFFKVHISNREELEHLADPNVIGEIIRKEDPEVLVVRKNSTTPVAELFRALRNNIQFILNEPDKKVILITSTVPNEGKTFISVNLAGSFALSEKKVLLIGMDIRNPQLALDMGFAKGKGLTSYLTGDAAWESMIAHVPEYPNLDILQAGVIPPNPNELLMNPRLEQLLEEVRGKYDYILIDSAPVGVVSDTLLVAKYADTTVYVSRENVTPKEAVTFINKLYREKRLPKMYLVINDVNALGNNKKYGYKYKYGYGYGYSQDTRKKKDKKR